MRNKAFNITKNLKYDGYQRGLSTMVYKLFDKKSKGGGFVNNNNDNNNKNEQNIQSPKELHKPIIKIFLKKNCLFWI